MGLLISRTRIGALVLAALSLTIASLAFADINAQSTPSRNHVDFRWWFPCSSSPSAGGHLDTATVGRPPADMLVARHVEDPDNPDNDVLMGCDIQGGQIQTYVRTEGCAKAGNHAFRISTDRPWAAAGSEAAPLTFRIDRTVVPGPAPDLVTLTYLGGSLQTFANGTDQAATTLKLIVYPDQPTADADAGLDGVGSVFYGATTLVGSSGDLVFAQGLAPGDFTVVSDGAGLFTATPLATLSKVVQVPDASTAVVSVVGDPKSTNASSSTTGVPGARLDASAWLAPASPNPTRGATRIRFSVPRDGHVALAVFDQQGRRVRQLVDESVVAGEHEAGWDGMDTRGERVPSGIYFYRLDVDGRLLIGKVLAIR
jgi:hypothetical protein